MAFDAQGNWTPEDDSVSKRVTGLMNQQNPFMQQAQTAGLKQANRRGLLNSSMAVGAAQGEAYKAALPIASQESQQIAAKNLQHIAGAQQKDIATMNIAAHDREKAQAAIAAATNAYTEGFRTIANNHEMPANARDAYLEHLRRLHDVNLNLIEQMYGIDLEWPTA
jgi:hypothetical protein